jgi:hypothetical protein
MKLSKMLYVLGICTLLIALAAPRMYALPASEVETIYFAGPADEEVIGYSFLACDGSFYREGRTSRYKAITQTPCYDVPTPPEQPGGICYYNLQTGESGCCTWIEGDCPTNMNGIIITSTTP